MATCDPETEAATLLAPVGGMMIGSGQEVVTNDKGTSDNRVGSDHLPTSNTVSAGGYATVHPVSEQGTCTVGGPNLPR